MDSFELNKILGAILGTLLFVMGVGFLAEGIYSPIVTSGSSYNLPEPAAGGATAAVATAAVPLPERLAKADPAAGADSAKKCQSCHDFSEGGANKTGPALYDVVDRAIASHPGYEYSDALKAHATQIDPDGFFFKTPMEWQQRLWPTEEFELARSRVPTTLPEDDLFAGIEDFQ